MNTEQECKLKKQYKGTSRKESAAKVLYRCLFEYFYLASIRWTIRKPLKEQLCLMRESHSASRI